MKDSQKLIHQVERKIVQSQNNSTTEAGQSKSEDQQKTNHNGDLVDAINEAFELLRINYQHLYFSAYKEITTLNAAKRLWLENLSHVPPRTILQAVHLVIKQSDYLPTISKIVTQCARLNHIPDVHSAYIEACQAPSPKQNAKWNHPIIYYAGKKTNWFFLQNNSETTAFPVFKQNYQILCEQLANGIELPKINPISLPESSETALSKAENAERMATLLDKF